MQNVLAKIESYFSKPIATGSSTSIGTVLVLALIGLLTSVYMGWINLKKRAW